MPNLLVFRPGDAVETAEAWQCAIEAAKTPSILALSRQDMPQFRQGDMTENKTALGGYIVAGDDADRQVTLIASGSEVCIALAARNSLLKGHCRNRGIYALYGIIPVARCRLSKWYFGVCPADRHRSRNATIMGLDAWPKSGFIGMNGFGASAPINDLYAHFGITEEAVVATARQRLGWTVIYTYLDKKIINGSNTGDFTIGN